MISTAPRGAVVVGVDGSAAATRAALWGAFEADHRDVPLHLMYVIDPADTQSEDDGGHRAIAETALRQARSLVRAALPDLTTELRIGRGKPAEALRRASAKAALLCTGVRGRQHFADGHTGSTALALTRSAHCPVAVINDHDRRRPGQAGRVVAAVDESPDSDAVVSLAVHEALLRNIPLQVVGCGASASRLERRVSPWRHRCPELDITTAVLHEPLADYLSRHAHLIELSVIGAPDTAPVLDSGNQLLVCTPRRM